MTRLEDRMRKAEWFHSLTVPDDMWIVLRLDGRSFTKLTENMAHPFDEYLHDAMGMAMMRVFEDLGCVYAETHSDEISLVLQPDTDLFSREVEKLVSVSASLASSSVTLSLGKPCSFDSRVIMFPNYGDVTDYFLWRQHDCHRGCVNSYLYWLLRDTGKSGRQAHSIMDGLNTDQKNAFLLEEFGTNYTTDVPAWQKTGSGIFWKLKTVEGWNPIKEETEKATRRYIKLENGLPYGDDYREFLDFNLHSLSQEHKWCFIGGADGSIDV